MASGYEKSPDYGGPEPRWPEFVLIALAIIGAAAAYAWLANPYLLGCAEELQA